jgi:hypothetical protein
MGSRAIEMYNPHLVEAGWLSGRVVPHPQANVEHFIGTSYHPAVLASTILRSPFGQSLGSSIRLTGRFSKSGKEVCNETLTKIQTMKMISVLFAACTAISVPAYSWDYTKNYENIPPRDVFGVQTPAIIKTVQVGGFNLDVDRVETGVYLPNRAKGDFLGEFRGKAFDIKVLQLPKSNEPLEKVAAESHSNAGSVVRVANVEGPQGVRGVRVEYGDKPNFFSSNIQAIRYFFVNPSGQTICFDARATKPFADWSIVNHLISDTISPATS